MENITYKWHTSRLNETCHAWMSRVTNERAVWPITWSHVTDVTGPVPSKEDWHTSGWHITYGWVVSSLTHTIESCHTQSHTWQCCICDMGWLRLVGSLKWQVSFAEYRLFHRALLQKRPIILGILLIVATPHIAPIQHKAHIWVSHVARMHESCCICKSVV